jgi:hypothetical protein
VLSALPDGGGEPTGNASPDTFHAHPIGGCGSPPRSPLRARLGQYISTTPEPLWSLALVFCLPIRTHRPRGQLAMCHRGSVRHSRTVNTSTVIGILRKRRKNTTCTGAVGV